jgi:hypothetical protein
MSAVTANFPANRGRYYAVFKTDGSGAGEVELTIQYRRRYPRDPDGTRWILEVALISFYHVKVKHSKGLPQLVVRLHSTSTHFRCFFDIW